MLADPIHFPPKVFFWQNMPAHHQVGALEFLALIWGSPVTGVWCSDISDSRRRQGWPACRREALQDIFLPSKKWESVVDDLIDANRDGIHIFSGIGAYRPVTRALRRLGRSPGAKMGLVIESPIMYGWRRWVRLAKARYYYAGYINKFNAVFTMGSVGVQFYQNLGFSKGQIYPYLYQEEVEKSGIVTPGEKVKLAYVGQLSRRKGVDILFDAIKLIDRTDWTLELFGDGPDMAMLRERAAAGPHAGRISFRGVVPSGLLMGELRQKDLMIVPSRFDGWGMAVNEALQCGMSVLASSMVGASDLVRASKAGAVFESERPEFLAEDILRRLTDRSLLLNEKLLAHRYAEKISPQAAGAYMSSALKFAFLGQGKRPTAGWLS